MDDSLDNVLPPGKQVILASEITRNDVLFGRGGSINTNPGNERFRQLVDSRKRLYLTARFKREKRLIASNIVGEIHSLNPPGRFLAKVPVPEAKKGERGANALVWYEVDLDKARDKTSQALREGAPVIRMEMEGEIGCYGVAGQTTNNFDDDYEDRGAYASEEEFDKSQEMCNPTQSNSNYFWRQPFDVPIPPSWNSFRDLATNVAAAAMSFSPYFVMDHEKQPPASHGKIHHQYLPSSLPTNDFSVSKQTVGDDNQQPRGPFYNSFHRGEVIGLSSHYPAHPSAASVPIAQPTNPSEYYWSPKVHEHLSMPPLFNGQMQQSSTTTQLTGVLPVAVTPERTNYQQAIPNHFCAEGAINDGNNAFTIDSTGSLFRTDQREQRLQHKEAKSESIRTLNSEFIQSPQTWEEDLYDGDAHFEDDTEMENVKEDLQATEQRDDGNAEKEPWSNLETLFTCGLDSSSFTLCNGGFDNFSEASSLLGGPSLCGVFNELEEQFQFFQAADPVVTSIHVISPPQDCSSNYNVPTCPREEEIELHLGRRRMLSPLTLKSEKSEKSFASISEDGTEFFRTSNDKSSIAMDLQMTPSPVNSARNRMLLDEPTMFDFVRVWKAGSRDQ